jgi:hypothetical protein
MPSVIRFYKNTLIQHLLLIAEAAKKYPGFDCRDENMNLPIR